MEHSPQLCSQTPVGQPGATYMPAMCRVCASCVTYPAQLILMAHRETGTVAPILQKRNLTLRESQRLYQGVTATLKAMVSP